MRTTISPLFRVLFIALWPLVHAHAFDWDAARQNLGAVEVTETKLTPVGTENEKGPWVKIPSLLAQSNTSTYAPKSGAHNEVEYRVTKGGWIFFAAFFGNEGNGGEWRKERKDEKQLQADGWTFISSDEVGGAFIYRTTHEYKILAKLLPEGAHDKFHVNKYSAPQFLSFAEFSPAAFAAFAALPRSATPAATSPGPLPPNIPAAPANPNPARPGSMSAADVVKANRANLVFVTTADGAGSGFIAHYGTATFLITNAHVAAGAREAMFKTLDGTQLQVGAPAAAVDHDIFVMALSPGGTPLEIMSGVDQDASIGDAVVVLGNSEGAGVINTIQGKIVGIGPNLVEVDAPFQPGNSGSPIIQLKTGKVIGVATYLTIRKYDSATRQPVKDPIVRRFGYRLDSVKSWQAVNWKSFYAQATEMEALEKLTDDLVAFIQDLSKDGRVSRGEPTNPAIKNRIDQWHEAKSKRLSPQDAAQADQSLLSFLKITCQSDITAAQQHLTYDYFQRHLADQQRERKEIADVFTKIIDDLRK